MENVDDTVVEHFKQWAARKGRIDQDVLEEPKEVLLEKLHLKNGSYLTNAAMLLFSQDPENWTLENLMKKHASSPYNPNIAHVFYLAGFIESWGRGIEKMCSACEKDGVPQPEYTIYPGDIMIKFTAPEDRIVGPTARKVTEKVTEKEQELLGLLLEDPGYTMPQLADKLKISRKTVATRLKSLKEKGVVKRIGSDRKGYWKILQ